MEVGIILAMIGAVVGEFLAGTEGLGHMGCSSAQRLRGRSPLCRHHHSSRRSVPRSTASIGLLRRDPHPLARDRRGAFSLDLGPKEHKMNMMTRPASARSRRSGSRAQIGRHTEKSFDWDAFPSNRGFPETGARADALYRLPAGRRRRAKADVLTPRTFHVEPHPSARRQLCRLPCARNRRGLSRHRRRA